MTHALSNSHQRTHDAILAQPASHTLQWRDVRSLLEAMATVVDEPNGNVKVTRNGQQLVLHPDRHKDVGAERQLHDLRSFLQSSGDRWAPPVVCGVHLLVVVDHREARVYRTEMHGSVPERIVPHSPDHLARYLHYVRDDSNGQRRPELKSYYDEIAGALRGAESVVLFGSGTGASSAMDHLRSELKLHHKDVAGRVVGAVAVDEHHLTEDQLLAKAREFFAARAASVVTPVT